MKIIKIILAMLSIFILGTIPVMASTLVSEEFFSELSGKVGDVDTKTLGESGVTNETNSGQMGLYTYSAYNYRGAFLLNFTNYSTCTFNDAQIYFTRENGYSSTTAKFYYSLNQTLEYGTDWATQPCGNILGTITKNCVQDSFMEISTASHSNGETFQPDVYNGNLSTLINTAIQTNGGLISFELASIDTEGISEKGFNIYNSRRYDAGTRSYLNVSYDCLPPDTTSPVINSTSISNILPQYNTNVYLSAECSDDGANIKIYYANNITGVLANISNSGFQTQPYNYSVTTLNNMSYGSNIKNVFTCVDQSLNSVQSSELIFVSEDSTLPVLAWQPPTPGNGANIDYVNVRLNISINESNLRNIILNYNGTNETNTFTHDTGNDWHIDKLITSLGTYTYSIYVDDTAGNFNTISTRSFIVDNVTPAIIWTIPATGNTTSITRTGNLNIVGVNINLDIGNLTIYNMGGDVIYNNVVTNINNPTYTFSDSLTTIFGSQPDGTYLISACFQDYITLSKCELMLITIITPPVPPENLGIKDVLQESGIGFGNFLEAIRNPVVKLVFGFVALVMLAMLVVGIARIISNKINKLR